MQTRGKGIKFRLTFCYNVSSPFPLLILGGADLGQTVHFISSHYDTIFSQCGYYHNSFLPIFMYRESEKVEKTQAIVIKFASKI